MAPAQRQLGAGAASARRRTRAGSRRPAASALQSPCARAGVQSPRAARARPGPCAPGRAGSRSAPPTHARASRRSPWHAHLCKAIVLYRINVLHHGASTQARQRAHPRRGAHARSARRPARGLGRSDRARERRARRHALPPLRQSRRRARRRLAACAGTLSAARAGRRRRASDPLDAAVAMAASQVAFARERPEDARLLLTLRRDDLLDGEPAQTSCARDSMRSTRRCWRGSHELTARAAREHRPARRATPSRAPSSTYPTPPCAATHATASPRRPGFSRTSPQPRAGCWTMTTSSDGPRRAPLTRAEAPSGHATSRSFCASARDCSFFSDWFSIWRMRSRVTLNVRPTSSSVRGCSPPRP